MLPKQNAYPYIYETVFLKRRIRMVAMYFCSHAYPSFAPPRDNAPFSVFCSTDKVHLIQYENTDINRNFFQIIASFPKQTPTNPPRYV